jgi:hypothetical protein
MSAASRLRERLIELRDQTGDTHLLALVRIGFGVLLGNEAWLATDHFLRAGDLDTYFHQPMFGEWFVAGHALYRAVLVTQWLAAALIVTGRFARPALLAAAGALLYLILCDRLQFHHYRHTMIAFSTLFAFAPCDRHLVLGLRGDDEPAPLWAANAMKAQVSIMYLTSGGSKAFDPDWRDGHMMRMMIGQFRRLVEGRGVTAEWVEGARDLFVSGLLARGAIATEISLAVLLWWPRTRRVALWVGLMFHVSISLMTPVMLFTAEMLVVYLVFVTPDRHARVLQYGPQRAWLAKLVRLLDWFGRYRLEPSETATLAVVDRGGMKLERLGAAATLFGTLPALFPFWPVVGVIARASRGRQRAPA